MTPSAGRAPTARAVPVTLGLMAGYVGIYLCRKNLAVATPLLKTAFGVGDTELGRVASIGTLAYAAGKITLGPLIDRIGGRAGFLVALAGVALFGAASAFAPSLILLGAAYALGRGFGAAGWPAMMKLAPTWYAPAKMATVVAVLSLAYVLGGSAATLLARAVIEHGGSWRAVLGVPALVLVGIAAGCALVVRKGPFAPPASTAQRGSLAGLVRERQFLLVCALSFALTLLRESFNTWSVDFLTTLSPKGSVAAAALHSTSFDLAGAASILMMGVAFDRVPRSARRWLLAGILAALAALVGTLPSVTAAWPASATWLLGGVGLLVYGPYSLMAGALAIDAGGPERAATASGVIDAVGYAAGVLAGEGLGRVLDAGSYALAFRGLAVVAAVAAVLALGLRGDRNPRADAPM